MTQKPTWQNLKLLVTCDAQLISILEKINEKKALVTAKTNDVQDLLSALEELQQLAHDAKKKVHSVELEANELKQRDDEKKAQLDAISNPKEYKGLEKERKILSQKILAQEDELVKAWYDLDAKTKLSEIKQAEYDTAHAKFIEETNAISEEIKKLQADYEQAKIDRPQIVERIPEEWMKQYERMKHSVPDPIVPVLRSTCSSCFYPVLKQDFAKLKNHGLLLCRSCYRFLYFDEAEEKESQVASY